MLGAKFKCYGYPPSFRPGKLGYVGGTPPGKTGPKRGTRVGATGGYRGVGAPLAFTNITNHKHKRAARRRLGAGWLGSVVVSGRYTLITNIPLCGLAPAGAAVHRRCGREWVYRYDVAKVVIYK